MEASLSRDVEISMEQKSWEHYMKRISSTVWVATRCWDVRVREIEKGSACAIPRPLVSVLGPKALRLTICRGASCLQRLLSRSWTEGSSDQALPGCL